MPTPKQMEKLAAEASRESGVPAGAPEDPLPAEYWQSVLQDPRAHSNGLQTRQMPLSELQRCKFACNNDPLRGDFRVQ